MELVEIAHIRREAKHQPRVDLDKSVIKSYAELVKAGKQFPPVKIVRDKGGNLWLWNGFHRVAAYWDAGETKIHADITNGTQRDAFKLSLGANAENGLHRSNEDKRRAVQLALKDSEFVKMSDVIVAEICAVSVNTVKNIRAEMESASQIAILDTRVGKDGKEYKVKDKKPKLYGAPVSTVVKATADDLRESHEEECDDPQDGMGSLEGEPAATKAGKAAEPVVQEEPPARPPINPTVDKHGRQIPTHLVPVFADPVWDELTNLAHQMTVKLGQVGATDGGFYLIKDMESHDGKKRLRSFEEAKRSIKFCRPEGVCPVCDGEGCEHCYKKGFVHRIRFKAVEGVASV